MTVVVDASVLVAAITDEGPEGRWAESLLAGSRLAAPHLVLVETTNVLRRLEGTGKLTRLEATSAQRDAMWLNIELWPFEPFSQRVWELRANLTSYDAWHVALAEALGRPLATLDRRIATSPGPGCTFVLPG